LLAQDSIELITFPSTFYIYIITRIQELSSATAEIARVTRGPLSRRSRSFKVNYHFQVISQCLAVGLIFAFAWRYLF